MSLTGVSQPRRLVKVGEHWLSAFLQDLTFANSVDANWRTNTLDKILNDYEYWRNTYTSSVPQSTEPGGTTSTRPRIPEGGDLQLEKRTPENAGTPGTKRKRSSRKANATSPKQS